MAGEMSAARLTSYTEYVSLMSHKKAGQENDGLLFTLTVYRRCLLPCRYVILVIIRFNARKAVNDMMNVNLLRYAVGHAERCCWRHCCCYGH